MSKPIVDISKWQGSINWPLLISQTDGVIIRASFGLAADSNFLANAAGAALHPGEKGAYCYVLSGTNGAAQAIKFADTVRASGVQFDYLVADFEDNSAGLSQSALRARYKLFLDTLAAELPGVEIRIYTRATFWDPNIGVAGWEKNYPLWVAHYTSGEPTIPAAWSTYTLHQYTDKGNGAAYGVSSASIDLNRVNPAIVPPPPPPAQGYVPFKLECRDQNQNVRSEPSTQGGQSTVVDHLVFGSHYAVYDVVVEPGTTNVWARLSPLDQAEKWAAVTHNGTVYLE